MTTVAIMTLTQVGANLLAAIITTATLAATASVAATSPDSMDSRLCFRAITLAGASEAILAVLHFVHRFVRLHLRIAPILGPIDDVPQTEAACVHLRAN